MLRDVVVEIIPGNPCRLIYSEGDYNLHCIDEIIMPRVFSGFYGWVIGYGAPPDNHVCGLFLTDKPHDYGEHIQGQVIGAIQCKESTIIVFIDPERTETSIDGLKPFERKMLEDFSPCDQWLSKAKAIEWMNVFNE